MKFVVDRIELDFAVVETENKKIYNIPKDFLPDLEEGKTYIITETESQDSEKDIYIKDGIIVPSVDGECDEVIDALTSTVIFSPVLLTRATVFSEQSKLNSIITAEQYDSPLFFLQFHFT